MYIFGYASQLHIYPFTMIRFYSHESGTYPASFRVDTGTAAGIAESE